MQTCLSLWQRGIIHGHYSTDENWPQFIVFCLHILFRFYLAAPPGSRVTVISWDERLYLLAEESEEFLRRLDDFQGSSTLTFSFYPGGGLLFKFDLLARELFK